MADWSNYEYARAALNDPRLPAAELGAMAAAQPALWPQIAAHPAAYPDLLGWLEARGVQLPPRPPAPQHPAQSPHPAQQFVGQPQHPGQPQYPGQAFAGPQYAGQPQPDQPQRPGQPQHPGQQYAGQPQRPESPSGQQFGAYPTAGYPAAPQGQTPASAPGKRNRMVLIIVAAVLVLGGGAGAWALTQGASSAEWRPTTVRQVPPGTPADVGR